MPFTTTQNNEILKYKLSKTCTGLLCWKLYNPDEKNQSSKSVYIVCLGIAT